MHKKLHFFTFIGDVLNDDNTSSDEKKLKMHNKIDNIVIYLLSAYQTIIEKRPRKHLLQDWHDILRKDCLYE